MLLENPHRSHLRADIDGRLSDFLMRQTGLSAQRLGYLLNFGAIYVNGRRQRSDIDIRKGDILRVHFKPKRYRLSPIPIVFENDDLIIVDKPSGLPTHPTLDNYVENTWFQAQEIYQRAFFVTHRLDIPTEGLLILAKTADAQARINHLFEKRQVQKVYHALTEIPVPLGRHRHFMQLEERPPKPIFSEPVDNSCEAVLTVLQSWEDPRGFACEIQLETGRTHQIRAQLAALGCPILGDHLYGSKIKCAPEQFALECFRMSFTYYSRAIGISRPMPLVSPRSTKDF